MIRRLFQILQRVLSLLLLLPLRCIILYTPLGTRLAERIMAGINLYAANQPGIGRINIQMTQFVWPILSTPGAVFSDLQILTTDSRELIRVAKLKVEFDPAALLLWRIKAAKCEFSDLTTTYFAPLLTISGLSGNGLLFPGRLQLQLTAGAVRKSTLESSSIDLENWPDAPFVHLSAVISGPATDVDQFVDLLNSNGQSEPAFCVSSGRACTTLELSGPFSQSSGFGPGINYNAHIDGQAIEIADFFGWTMTDGNFQIDANARQTLGQGQAAINGVPTCIDWLTHINQPPPNSVTTIRARLTATDLKQLDFSDFPAYDGTAILTLQIRPNPNFTTLEMVFDLHQTAFDFILIGLHKNSNVAAQLQADINIFKDGQLELQRLELIGAARLQASGHGFLNTHNNLSNYQLHVHLAQYAENDFCAEVYLEKGNYRIQLSGACFDMRPILKLLANPASAEANTFTGDIDIRLNRALFFNHEQAQSLYSISSWVQGQLIAAQLTWQAPGRLLLTYQPTNKSAQLTGATDDAGAMLRALTRLDLLKSGQLKIHAARDSADSVWHGQVSLTNSTLTQAPLLARILSLASLTGLLELLNSGGVVVEHLEAQISYTDNLLTVKDGQLKGFSLGLTGDGTLDFKRNQIRLDGLLIPFNAANKIARQIPVIGKMMPDESLVAAQYHLRGRLNDPQILVDPLSALKRGVIGRLFDFF